MHLVISRIWLTGTVPAWPRVLIPLIHDDDDEQAVTFMTPYINSFAEQFNTEFTAMWAQKAGLRSASSMTAMASLVAELLALLKDHELDYTNTFDALNRVVKTGSAVIPESLISAMEHAKWVSRVD